MSGPAGGAPLPFTARTRTVLVVEDDDDARATLAAMVTELGYRVLEAENGKSALPLLEQDRPVDILLSDVVMPGGGYVTTYTDITALKRAEEMLRESAARLRAVFDNTPVCLNLKDTEGRYLLATNPMRSGWVTLPRRSSARPRASSWKTPLRSRSWPPPRKTCWRPDRFSNGRSGFQGRTAYTTRS